MDNNLRDLCEQIQDGILTYADSGLATLSMENLDDLCEIVVQAFQRFSPDESFQLLSEKQSFLIKEIEFDVSGSEYGYWAPGEWSEEELQAGLQNEWIGKIVGPVLEEEITNLITDSSGWCVNQIAYEQC